MNNIISKYTGFFLVLMLTFTFSCEDLLDLKPYDAQTADNLLQDDGGIRGLTNGSLRMMKDLGYVRHLSQLTGFPSDNVLIVNPTTDVLWLSFNRAHIPAQSNTSSVWSVGYKIMLNTNQIINNIEVDESTDALTKQYLGESYFYRAVSIFNLARVFSFPPSHGLDNNGIVLRTTLAGEDAKARATVGETYHQIISDLNMSVDLMTERAADGIKYGNKGAALGYLSRAYLFTEKWDSVVYVANQVLDGDFGFSLEPRDNYVYSMQNSATSKENMFIIYHTDSEFKGTGAIGSMFNGDGGWGEVYPSKPYRELISKHPNDIRCAFLDTIFNEGSGAVEIYPGTSYEEIYMTKFSYQSGIATCHSPIYMRLAEVILNRAEAYAHMGDMDQEALDDVNTIRERAGLSGAELYTLGNLASHGLSSVLDAVLVERRLEFAFEGYRRDDLLRNKIDLDRTFPSAQNGDGEIDILPYDAPRQIYYIPSAEEIAYNPLCVQND